MSEAWPPLITDPARWKEGYLYVPEWEAYQHRDVTRWGRAMAWHKEHNAQLGHPDYLALTFAERGLLHGVRMVVAAYGQGRVSAAPASLQRMLGVRSANVLRHLHSVVGAGFVEVRAGRLLVGGQPSASLEERRGDTTLTGGGVSTATSESGAAVTEATAPDPNGDLPPEWRRLEELRVRSRPKEVDG